MAFLDFLKKKNAPEEEPEQPLSPEKIQAIQEAINRIYPGLTMFVRDVDLAPALAEKYKPGMILRERAFVDCTCRVGGMATTHRFGILSNHVANLDLMGEDTGWGLCVANRDSHFKVLGIHTYSGKTIILLLHLPDDDSWKLFRNTQIDLDEKLVEDCCRRFEAKCCLPPIPELAGREWLDRCEFPVGMDDSGNFWPLE